MTSIAHPVTSTPKAVNPSVQAESMNDRLFAEWTPVYISSTATQTLPQDIGTHHSTQTSPKHHSPHSAQTQTEPLVTPPQLCPQSTQTEPQNTSHPHEPANLSLPQGFRKFRPRPPPPPGPD